MTIKIRIDKDILTLDDFIMFDDMRSGQYDNRHMRDFIARFMVDDDGVKLDNKTAIKEAGKLTRDQVNDVFIELGNFTNQLKEEAVNPTKSGS